MVNEGKKVAEQIKAIIPPRRSTRTSKSVFERLSREFDLSGYGSSSRKPSEFKTGDFESEKKGFTLQQSKISEFTDEFRDFAAGAGPLTHNKLVIPKLGDNDVSSAPPKNIAPSSKNIAPPKNSLDGSKICPSYSRKIEVKYNKSKQFCWKCNGTICAGAVRIAILVKKQIIWAHPACVDLRGKEDDIVGLDLISEVDRTEIQTLMNQREQEPLVKEVTNNKCFSICLSMDVERRIHSLEEDRLSEDEDAKFYRDMWISRLQKFVQATFIALPAKGSTIAVSGDGRCWSKEAIQIIIKMAAAHGVKGVWVGLHGLISTPAISGVIRNRTGPDGSKASGAFVMTAIPISGSPHEDFRIRYNMENGGPATKEVTDRIYKCKRTINEYNIAKTIPDVDLSTEGVSKFKGPKGEFYVDVFDSVNDYVQLMKSIFDFESIRELVASPNFTFCYDALRGVAGAYAQRIFVQELGAHKGFLRNCVLKEDLRGGHPDPNLSYAEELVKQMGLTDFVSNPTKFGAVTDGDADRNMTFGKSFFVNPSDSVAIIAANAAKAIPWFSSGLKGVARSIPTSAALDDVAKRLNLKFTEVPAGSEFFGLMDTGECSICGDENFTIGSNYIREMDGLWGVLAWMSVLAYYNKNNLQKARLLSVEDVVRGHWSTYGRHYFTRHDYEDVNLGAARELMANLVSLKDSLSDLNKSIKKLRLKVADVDHADEFEYKDPFDGFISKHRGIKFLFADRSRLIFRVSRISSDKATIRFYIDKYEENPVKVGGESEMVLAPLVKVAQKISRMKEITGLSKPKTKI